MLIGEMVHLPTRKDGYGENLMQVGAEPEDDMKGSERGYAGYRGARGACLSRIPMTNADASLQNYALDNAGILGGEYPKA